MCRICDYVLANPSHPYMTICQDQEAITGRVGLRSPLPEYNITLARNLDALWVSGCALVGKYETAIVVLGADQEHAATLDRTYRPFADVLDQMDPFQNTAPITLADIISVAL